MSIDSLGMLETNSVSDERNDGLELLQRGMDDHHIGLRHTLVSP